MYYVHEHNAEFPFTNKCNLFHILYAISEVVLGDDKQDTAPHQIHGPPNIRLKKRKAKSSDTLKKD